jgi:hypothetical protein
MNQPAPTSAPTEQDKERAREVVREVMTKPTHLVTYVHSLEEAIAAALQAERERTRAEDVKVIRAKANDAESLSHNRHVAYDAATRHGTLARGLRDILRDLEQLESE